MNKLDYAILETRNVELSDENDRLRKENIKLKDAVKISIEALQELGIPYSARGYGNNIPRFPDIIINEALANLKKVIDT